MFYSPKMSLNDNFLKATWLKATENYIFIFSTSPRVRGVNFSSGRTEQDGRTNVHLRGYIGIKKAGVLFFLIDKKFLIEHDFFFKAVNARRNKILKPWTFESRVDTSHLILVPTHKFTREYLNNCTKSASSIQTRVEIYN